MADDGDGLRGMLARLSELDDNGLPAIDPTTHVSRCYCRGGEFYYRRRWTTTDEVQTYGPFPTAFEAEMSRNV